MLPQHLVICKDEMTDSADPEHFQKRLWDMFNVQFRSKLTMPQVDRIRALLFPEIRISQPSLPLRISRVRTGSMCGRGPTPGYGSSAGGDCSRAG